MSAQLWLGIGHYLLGVLVIFALLVALMETSRKFDKFHDSSYLLLASGYFLLLVWSLVRAMTLSTSLLQVTGIICEIAGFICLVVGYYYHQRSHPVDDDTAEVATSPSKAEPVKGWMKLLSAGNEPDEAEPEAETTEETASNEDNGLKSNDPVPTPELTKPIKKKEKTETEVDLSYLGTRKKANPVEKPPVEAEKREQLMDDLFPVKSDETLPKPKPKKAKPVKPIDSLPDGDEKLPGELDNDKPLPAILLTNGIAAGNWLTVWPELIVSVVLITVILALIPQRHQRGNGWLLTGFVIIFLANLLSLFLAPQLAGLILSTDVVGCGALVIHLVEVIGFAMIGVASWAKIKGKVTHHFLRIVSIIYLLLLTLTVGLALVIVHDQTSLQLLLLLMTGVLITILPIIHSLTYSHPHQPLNEDSQ